MIPTKYQKVAFLADGGFGDWLPMVSLVKQFVDKNPQLEESILVTRLYGESEKDPYGAFPLLKDYYRNLDFITQEAFIPHQKDVSLFLNKWVNSGVVDSVLASMMAYKRPYVFQKDWINYNLIRALVEHHVEGGHPFELLLYEHHLKQVHEKWKELCGNSKIVFGFQTRIFGKTGHWRLS